MARKDRQPTETPPPQTSAEPPARNRRRIVACAGCGGLFALALIVFIVWINAWDSRDSRLHEGRPLPENVAYIGRWVSDDALSARTDTFAVAGDRIACDFAIRNDSARDVTVLAIGRTIIAPPLDARLSQQRIGLELMEGDVPMEVTDEENVLGLTQAMGGVWIIIDPGEATGAAPPEPFTLKRGETRRFRYRPHAHQMLMPASALRIAVLLDDGSPPRPFYFLRKSAGIAGWFERSADKAMSGGR